ncbi:hypothetical protein F5Y08DRAFT_335517 [Xylaria arbuscula]|nr:hypothetical protein F5Y08DRAFT_335517 [Xylaria arbuscula]
MLGLSKAAVVLVPVLSLALAAAVPIRVDNLTPSSSLVTLELGGTSDRSPLEHTALDLRIYESTTPCGQGNVTLNEEPLVQDALGLGSGPLTIDSGSVLGASWKFTCVHREGGAQAQLLSVHIISLDSEDVDGVTFSVQFQQTAPISISHIDGATIRTELPPPTSGSPGISVPSLEDELAELEMLKEQLLALEHSIALKVTHISSTFNLEHAEKLLADCDNLKCFFSTIYDKMRTMASKVYHSSHGKPSVINIQPGPLSTGGQRPLKDSDDNGHVATIPASQEAGEVSSKSKPKGSKSNAVTGNVQSQQSASDDSHQVRQILVLVVISLVILINIAIMILMFQCVRLLRQRRQARWEKRRQRLRKSRAACNSLVTTKYLDLIQWLRGSTTRETIEDQEKDAIMRRVSESDSDGDSSDTQSTLSISMEEELAQFRAAAGFVGDLVAEEGRGRDRLSNHFPFTRRRRASTPSSMSSCPTYRSVDETLPAYDENCSPEYVLAGSSTHGSSSRRSSTSQDSTACSSLDEDMEKKE